MRRGIALALAVAGGAFASPPRFVDYLYIEANEGGSSGGHAALRLGDETYHFQHEAPGVLRLRRDGSEHFRYAYGVLENRTMHLSRVAVPDATYAELRQRFSERYLIERKLFAERDALSDDRVLLERLLAHRRGDTEATIRLRGAGFFFPEDGGTSPSAAALTLLRRVKEAYGADAVDRRIEQVRRELMRLTPGSTDSPTPDVPAQGYPQFAYPFSSGYRDLLSALAALEALARALPLRADARRAAVVEALDPVEHRALAAFADRLEEQLVRLLRSERPDWGYPFLVGMARLAALRESERTGRLMLLDAFPPGAEVVPWRALREYRHIVPDLLAEAREELTRARARLRSGVPIEERDYADVEAAANRLLELDAAANGQRRLRVSEELLPSRDAPWADLVVPAVPEDELAVDLARAKTRARRFAAQLERRYAYDLFSHNCVSEIFATVGVSGAGLGGRLDGRKALDFIPFVSARAVDRRWNVAQRTTLWSYRRSQLAEMYRREEPLHVWLRECNTLTSTIYRRNADDSFFLLFTDDAVALRPLFGAVNVAGALGAGAVGVALLPFDRGHLLASSVRGALFSLPELAFVNLRKGSFAYVRRADRPLDASPGAAGTPGERL